MNEQMFKNEVYMGRMFGRIIYIQANYAAIEHA